MCGVDESLLHLVGALDGETDSGDEGAGVLIEPSLRSRRASQRKGHPKE